MPDLDLIKMQIDTLKDIKKNRYEYYRHLTTLCTGLIIIIITLTKGFFVDPTGFLLLAFSIGFLIISLILSLYMIQVVSGYDDVLLFVYFWTTKILNGTMSVEEFGKQLNDKIKILDKTTKVFHLSVDISFVLGIILFLIFTFINIT
jgi:hypothetical protein